MAATNAANQLMDEVTSLVRKEILADLQPIIKQIATAAAALQSKVGGHAVAVPARRGRKPGPKPGRKPGRKPAVKAAATAKAAPARRGPKPGKRNPRGALQAEITGALQGAGGALSLSEIRNRVIQSSLFRGRDPKTLYTQIVQAVKRLPNVNKTASGNYSLGARRGRKKKA